MWKLKDFLPFQGGPRKSHMLFFSVKELINLKLFVKSDKNRKENGESTKLQS